MNTTDKKISEVLAKFGEPMAGNVWRVQGTAVIYHKALERIAAYAKITFDEPKIIRAEKEEAVIQVTGRLPDGRMEWSIGEALIGVNYRVSGKQAAYVYAMAEKRAKDRVILKLIELSGLVYSEEEADEFKEARPLSTPSSAPSDNEKKAVEASKETQGVIERFKEAIKAKTKHEDVTAYMQSKEVQDELAQLKEGYVDEIRSYALDRMGELGWQPKRRAA